MIFYNITSNTEHWTLNACMLKPEIVQSAPDADVKNFEFLFLV